MPPPSIFSAPATAANPGTGSPPDLTRGEPQREPGETNDREATVYDIAFGCIYYVDESPVDARVIWVGTDDGNVQVTRDGGESWTEVSVNLPDAPLVRWISSVVASPRDAATAFATVQGHRSGDPGPHVYVTRDHGATWQSLMSGGVEGLAHIVRQDLVRADLLFLGTEFGLYVSVDGGRHWARFTGNLPKVAVRDLAIHPPGARPHHRHPRPRHLRPRRPDAPAPAHREVLEADVTLLGSRPAVLMASGLFQSFSGDDQFVGSNPPEAVWISYYLKKRHLFGDLRVEVYGPEGELITSVPGTKRRGLNRAEWALRLPPPKVPPAPALTRAFVGPRAAEGTYAVKLIKGKQPLTGEVELVADPRLPHSPEDRAVQQRVSMQLYERLAELTWVVEATAEARDQAREGAQGLRERDRVRRRLEELADRLDALVEDLVTSESGPISLAEEKLRENLASLYS